MERVRIQGLPNVFKYPLLSQEWVKLVATDFKFSQYIYRVHPNKSPLKILEKRERGCIRGLPIPQSRELVKLQTSNFVHTS